MDIFSLVLISKEPIQQSSPVSGDLIKKRLYLCRRHNSLDDRFDLFVVRFTLHGASGPQDAGYGLLRSRLLLLRFHRRAREALVLDRQGLVVGCPEKLQQGCLSLRERLLLEEERPP